MKKLMIIDASVLLTSLLGTKESVVKNLDRLLRDGTHQVMILPLTVTEFANGLRFSVRDGAAAEEALDAFGKLDLPVADFSLTDAKATLALSYDLNTTVYDTSYHHAALLRDGTFITCDRNYYKKASGLGHIELWG